MRVVEVVGVWCGARLSVLPSLARADVKPDNR